MTETPAGWYDDPEDDTQLRYWDGILWTAARAPKELPGRLAPPAGAPVVPAPAMSPYAAAAFRDRAPDGAPLAPWWPRFWAWVIDGVVILALTYLVARLLLPVQMRELGEALSNESSSSEQIYAQSGTFVLLDLLAWLVGTLYVVPCWMTSGRTLGKLATGLRVRMLAVRGPLSFKAAMTRRVIPLLSVIVGGVLSTVDGLFPLWDDRRQSLHDKMAGTVVVRTSAKA